MKKNLKRHVKGIVSYIALTFTAFILSASIAIPKNQTFFSNSDSYVVSSIAQNVSDYSGTHTLQANLFGTIPIKQVNVEVLPQTSLIPVGDVFGIKFFTKGVIVIGLSEIETENGFICPGNEAGLHKNDIITKVNGKEINTVEALALAVEQSNGKPLFVEFTHDGKTNYGEVLPCKNLSDGKYKTGIWVRDSTAGIGTMTYYNPKDGSFAGLGHGICDIDTGELMPLLRGTVVNVEISDIVKGKNGFPGELKGSFSSVKQGILTINSDFGVFGYLDSKPKMTTKEMAVAGRDDVLEGDATILVNADGKGVNEYSVRLSKINKRSYGTKCFVLEITDEKLLKMTGGIVQGMSGSPILQNGRIVGAVTHVFVNDPTRGYGIFIENMLAEAEKIK